MTKVAGMLEGDSSLCIVRNGRLLLIVLVSCCLHIDCNGGGTNEHRVVENFANILYKGARAVHDHINMIEQAAVHFDRKLQNMACLATVELADMMENLHILCLVCNGSESAEQAAAHFADVASCSYLKATLYCEWLTKQTNLVLLLVKINCTVLLQTWHFTF